MDGFNLDSNPERDLWMAETSILYDLDVVPDRIRFSKSEPIGQGVRLQVVGNTHSTSHINRVYAITG